MATIQTLGVVTLTTVLVGACAGLFGDPAPVPAPVPVVEPNQQLAFDQTDDVVEPELADPVVVQDPVNDEEEGGVVTTGEHVHPVPVPVPVASAPEPPKISTHDSVDIQTRKGRRDLNECWEKHGKGNGVAKVWKFTVEFTRSGRVDSVKAEPAGKGNEKTSKCLMNRIEEWRVDTMPDAFTFKFDEKF